jgi:hypothetical protein
MSDLRHAIRQLIKIVSHLPARAMKIDPMEALRYE